ncbi:hypothetical protein ATEIFO6365_0008049000 [Aspergillus terreus]|uniref:Uncharacterized protein n=1 Tax=Aspergillus terreus TaxID=33178 RepID=A0A5M3Z6V2_ASPTE|nr:hypothetical protein ATETN484_0010049900 [Aspergillus terreus]GFF18546.1 hypothetical protein ATEIFO6365_0008049000 [Aspergillus terreus]
MTQSHFSHHRRSASGPNATKARPARPALHRKGTSFVNHSISKLGAGLVRHCDPDDDCPPEMAASFLNFCAMCERQITAPDNSRLYCSESCRRKDSHKPLSASLSSTSLSSSYTPPTSPPLSPRTIVAPMTPTKLPPQQTPAIRIPSEVNDCKTDQDPTEWKPVISMSAGTSPLASSEAWQYLSQFHGGQVPLPVRRSRSDRSSASLSTLMSATATMPSLTHTPSTMASSFSSNASEPMSYPHDPVHRPLPPRHNPNFSSSASGTKGLDLVVPHLKVRVEEDSPIHSTRGSIFPADSSLWSDSSSEKTLTASAISMSPRHVSS